MKANKTKRICILEDERYPDYSWTLSDSGFGVSVEIQASTLKRWKKAQTAYDAAQKEMEDVYWKAWRKNE